MTTQCSERVFGAEHSFRGSMCSKPAKVERGGKAFCTIHDPERINAKTAERLARWERESQINAAKWKLQDLTRKAGELLAEHCNTPGLHAQLYDAAFAVQRARQALTALQETQKP